MKKLIGAFILLIIALIALLYLSLNSSKFITTYILPEISKRTGIAISAKEAKIVGLKSIKAIDLKIKDKDSFDFKTKKLKLSYSITQLFSKNLHLNSLELTQPKLELFEQKESSSKKEEKNSDWKAKIKAINISSGDFKNSNLEINNIGIKGSSSFSPSKNNYIAKGGITLGSLSSGQIKNIGLKSNFDIKTKSKNLEIKKLKIQLSNQEKNEILDLDLKGKVINENDIRIDLKSEKILLSKILKMFNISPELPKSSPEDGEKGSEKKSEEKTQKNPTPHKELELPKFLKNKTARINFDLKNITYQDYKFSNLKTKLELLNNKLSINDLSLNAINTKIFAKTSFDFNTKKFDGQLSSKLIQLADLNKKFKMSAERNYTGEIKDLNFNFSGQGTKKEDLDKNLAFSFYSKIKDIDFDKKFELVIPFNLIFIPFKGLQIASEKIPLKMLPEKVTGPFGEIVETLSNLDKLHCDKGEIKVSKLEDKVKLETANFDMAGIIPNLKLPGEINMNGDLKLNSKLEILKIWVPMPLTGTVDLPYPDLIAFGKELIKSIALAPIDLVSNAVN